RLLGESRGREEREQKKARGRGENEPEHGNPGEASARDGQARGEGGAHERLALSGKHDRVRRHLELPARKYHLRRQVFLSYMITSLREKDQLLELAVVMLSLCVLGFV
ncbi:hypothetical protein BHE74_00019509, partial [Ensete ventricosum]